MKSLGACGRLALSMMTLTLLSSTAHSRFLQADPIGYEDQINLYAYVENDPVNRNDPTGEKWEVTWHRVAPVSSARHAAIRFTPDDQQAARSHPQFNNVDGDGNRYVVISAGPESNRLVSSPNRSSDLGPQEGSTEFAIPKGKTELQYFNDVARADSAYNDKLDYDLFPAPEGQGSFFVPDDGYNSNSFVSGLLGATGVDVPKIDANLPGLNKPVPARCFKECNRC